MSAVFAMSAMSPVYLQLRAYARGQAGDHAKVREDGRLNLAAPFD
jgi:hypothetical protein